MFQSKNKKPKRLAIELTNRCNLNCPYCLVGQDDPHHNAQKRPIGDMPLELAMNTLCQAKDFGIEEILVNFQGEPLLYRHLLVVLNTAKHLGFKTTMFTNGILLTEEMVWELSKSKIDEIRFSIDGTDSDVYKKNRVGGNFHAAYKNIESLSRWFSFFNRKCKVIWQFIVMRNNEHQVEAAKDLAKKIGVKIYFKSFAASVPELVPVNKRYQRRLQKMPCRDIYKAIYVYWDGRVVPCCYDLNGEMVVGSLYYETLQEIWDGYNVIGGINYPELRKRIKKDNKSVGLCKRCLRWG